MGEPKWGAPERTIKRLLKERGLSMTALEKQHVAAANTTRKLWKEGVPRGTWETIARALEVDPDGIGFKVTDSVDPMDFYPAIGLLAAPPIELPDNGCYQDWSEEGDDQAIEYLWAEAEGSWIKAEVLPKKDKSDEEDPKKKERDEEDRRFLRVSFSNAVRTYASNLAIHPLGMRAVAADDKRHMVFQARLADTDLDGGKTKHKKSGIGIAVRVRDAKLRQWEYKLKSDHHILENITKKAPEWQLFSVDLNPESGTWQRVIMDPSPEGETPDFSVITSIVFDLGPRPRKRRPDVGQGTVDIDHIFLMAGPPSNDVTG